MICLQEVIPFPTFQEYLLQTDNILYFIIVFIFSWLFLYFLIALFTNSITVGLISGFIVIFFLFSFNFHTSYKEDKKLNDILTILPTKKFEVLDFKITKDKRSSSFYYQGEFSKKEKETVELNWVEYGVDMNRTSPIIIERISGDFEPYIEYKEIKIGIDSISVQETLQFEGTYNAVLYIPDSYNKK